MNKLKIGSIGADLNDDNGKLAKVYHIGKDKIYYYFINSYIEGICNIQDFWLIL